MFDIQELHRRVEQTKAEGMVPVTSQDREEFAVALVLQGYPIHRAWLMAMEEIEDNDGALQMLARRREEVERAIGEARQRELEA